MKLERNVVGCKEADHPKSNERLAKRAGLGRNEPESDPTCTSCILLQVLDFFVFVPTRTL